MDFDYSPKTKELQARVLRFMDDHIYPNEKTYKQELLDNTAAGKRWSALQTIEDPERGPMQVFERVVVVSLAGEPITGPDSLRIALVERAGATVTLGVVRGGQPLTVTAAVGSRP